MRPRVVSALLLPACITLGGLAVLSPTRGRVSVLGLLAVGSAVWALALALRQAQRPIPPASAPLSAPAPATSDSQHRRVVDQVDQVVFEVDGEARWTFLNPAWRALTGRNVDATLGQSVESTLHPDDRSSTLALLGALMEGERRDCRCEVRFTTVSGDVCWAEVRARALARGDEVVGVVGTITDVAALRQVRLDLEEARGVAERASSARSEFLRAMSHGMRTPLNGVIGLMDLLAATRLDSRQAHYVSVARASASHLGVLIDDILDLSRIEVGALPLERALFDLPDLLRRSVDGVSAMAAARHVPLTCTLTSRLPSWVVGDPGRLQQIVMSLLTSAVEASPGGAVHLQGDAQVDPGRRRASLRVEVLDTTSNPEAQPQPQARAGLGLTICRRLVAAMHGTMDVRGADAGGAHFVITVPLDLADAAMVEAHGAAGAPLRVLAVLPDDDERTAIGAMLEGWRIDAVVVPDCESAWGHLEATRASRSRFGVVVLDADAPGAAGFGPKLVHLGTPPGVIWLSRDEAATSDAAGRRHGLARPVQASELFDAIMDVVAWRTGGEALPPPAWAAPPVVLVAEDHDVNQVVIRELLVGIGCRVDLASNGDEAVRAASTRRYDAILMDCQMPVVDGLEATRRIRAAGDAAGHVPLIIALTANASAEDRQACLDAGMDAYLTKPVRATVLQRTLMRLLGDRAGELGAGAGAGTGDDDSARRPADRSRCDDVPEPDEILDPAELLLRCNHNGDLGARMLQLFAASLPAELDALAKGAAGGDLQAVSAVAHKMRGAAATLAAVRLAGAITAVESFLKYGDGGPLATLVADVEYEGALLLGVVPQVVRRLAGGEPDAPAGTFDVPPTADGPD